MTAREYTEGVRMIDWAREHRETLGRRYASEVGRRRDRVGVYSNS